MFEKFFPILTYNSINDIDLNLLKSKGIKGFILDIDNTLVPHNADADDNAVAWMEKIKQEGFKACIVSNASSSRVIKFNENIKVHAIHRASKPGSRAYNEAKDLMGITAKETVVVGDQLFTDIYGGNRVGMMTILVQPIGPKETAFIKLKRFFEKFIFILYKRSLKKAGKK